MDDVLSEINFIIIIIKFLGDLSLGFAYFEYHLRKICITHIQPVLVVIFL